MTSSTNSTSKSELIAAAAAALDHADRITQSGGRLSPQDAEAGHQAVSRALDAGVTHAEILAARRG